MSAKRLAQMGNALRRARLTGTLTAEERRAAAAAHVPSLTEQRRYLEQLAEIVERWERDAEPPRQ